MGAENEGGSWRIPSFRLISLQNTGNSNQLCCWETKMTICTCVYNYLCQKVVLARLRVFVYWSSDAPSLTPGHLPRVTGRTELSSQCRAAGLRWAEEFGQELKWTSRGGYGLMVNMCWSPPEEVVPVQSGRKPTPRQIRSSCRDTSPLSSASPP